MEAVNSGADFLTRHATQMPSRFHHAAYRAKGLESAKLGWRTLSFG